jgi:hypothetical protein
MKQLLMQLQQANVGAVALELQGTCTDELTLPALSIAGELWVTELCRHASQPAGEGLQKRCTAGAVQPHPQGVPTACRKTTWKNIIL